MAEAKAATPKLVKVEIVALADVFGENEARYRAPVYDGIVRKKRGQVVDLPAAVAADLVAKGLAQEVSK